MTKSRPLASNTQQAAPTNRMPKSTPEAFEVEPRDPTSTQKGGSETMSHSVSRETTKVPPKTFQDFLPPDLITTSTLSEAGYMGYRKSKSKPTRSSTFPPPSQSVPLNQPLTEPSDYPPATTTRRSTLKKMKGVMQSLKRSISNVSDSKKTTRLPIPSSSAFTAKSSRFGTGPGRQTFGRQDAGYLNLSDEEVGEEPKN